MNVCEPPPTKKAPPPSVKVRFTVFWLSEFCIFPYMHISLFMTVKSKYPTVFVEAHGRTLRSCFCFFYAMYQSGSLYILLSVFILNPVQATTVSNNQHLLALSLSLSIWERGNPPTEPFCVIIFILCALYRQDFGSAEHGAHETRCTMTVFVPARPVVQPSGSNTHINAVGTGRSSGTRETRRALGSRWAGLKLNTVSISSTLKPLH